MKLYDQNPFRTDSHWNTLVLAQGGPNVEFDYIASSSTPRAYFNWHYDDEGARTETTHCIYSTTDRLDELPEALKLRTLCVWLAAQLPEESLYDAAEYLTSVAESYQLSQAIDRYEVNESRLPGGKIRNEESTFFGYPED